MKDERRQGSVLSSFILHPSSFILPSRIRTFHGRRKPMALTAAQIEQQKKQAEELLFSGTQALGFAKGLFFGHFNAPLIFPYPQIKPEERETVQQAVAEVRRFAREQIDAAAIDRDADIPRSVIDGLGERGVLGM